jgi:hypothetical protein
MQQQNRRVAIRVYGSVLVVILTFFFALVFVLIPSDYSNAFSMTTICVGILATVTVLWFAIQAYVHRLVTLSTIFPLCHDWGKKRGLCPRCKGFYAGMIFFGALLLVRSTLLVDFLRYSGFIAYFSVMAFVLLLLLVHVILRRMEIIDGQSLLKITGFLFAMAIYMIATLVAVYT